MIQLRPLTTGEILDRTFSLYRRRFWLYCGISAIASSLVGVMQITEQMFMGQPATLGGQPQFFTGKLAIYGLLGTMVTLLLWLVAYSVTQAATASAVTTIYLGHETTLGKAMKVAGRKWWRYIFIALWQWWSAMWVVAALLIPALLMVATKVDALVIMGGILTILALLSLVYCVIAYIRNSLAVPASVFEGLTVRKSMRRSKTLASGRLWGIFLLSLLVYVLRLVAGMLQIPFALMMVAFNGKPGLHLLSEAMTVLITFVTGALVGPVASIALCLFYIDQRVRQEGFDLEAMMDPMLGSGALPTIRIAPPPPAVEPGGFAPSGFTAEPPSTVAPSAFPPSGFTAEPAGDGD